MKMVLISILIMLSIVVCSAANCRKINQATEELITALDQIRGADDSQGVGDFLKLWEEHRVYFSFSVPMQKLEVADNALLAIKASLETEDESIFIKGRMTARQAIEEISLYSSFDLKNIL